MNTIYFYSVNEPYGEFSNFAPYAIRLKDKTWPTVEHYYQAQKFAGQPDEEFIRRAPTADHAACMGRDPRRKIRNKWDCFRDEIMLEGVRAKFNQHLDLEKLLLSTGRLRLVEHSGHDSYWGDGNDGTGKNMLGRYLMKVRREIREKYRKLLIDEGRVEDIEAWVDYCPDDPKGLQALGNAFMESEHFDEAEDCFRLLVRMCPNHSKYRLGLAEAAAAGEKWRTALYHGRRAMKLAGGSGDVYACVGLIYLGLERYEKALRMLKLALRDAEWNGDYHTVIAQAYEAAGDYIRAESHFRRAYHIKYPNDSGGFDEEIDDNDENGMIR